jgi:EAL domain-containing protein (putative c-di-GMP-specific phosphodiesterase class I)
MRGHYAHRHSAKDGKLKVLLVKKVTGDSTVEESDVMGNSTPLEAPLVAAVMRRELTVHFQAQYEVECGQGCGVEALARWTLPDGEEISPTVFIPLAERIGMICPLGAWVLEHACETVAAWGSLGGHAPRLSVNVSALQINEHFRGVIDRTLKLTGLPAEQLELEITETALIANIGLAVECCEQWRALGAHIAVDDFGTGYSSLNYLGRLPVDRLKLDKSFAERMTFERKTAAIVRSILALGKEMGVGVVVEGVETEGQFALLEHWGCQQVQGFLLAKPLPAPEARALLMMPWGTRLAPKFRERHSAARGLHAA